MCSSLQTADIATSPGVCLLTCIAGSEKILSYSNEIPDVYKQIKEKNARESITKDITKEYIPCIFT